MLSRFFHPTKMSEVTIYSRKGESTFSILGSYVGLHGRAIAEAGKSLAHLVPAEFRAMKAQRDGEEKYHITVMRRNEVDMIIEMFCKEDPRLDVHSARAKLLRVLACTPDDWRDMGLGTVKADIDLGGPSRVPNRVFFKVIDWPGGRVLRAMLGLPPKDFHITVGYEHQDVFHLRKDERTLILRPPLAACARGWWPRLQER